MPWWAWLVLGKVAVGIVLLLALSPRARKVVIHPLLARLHTKDDWHTARVKAEEKRVRRAARLR